MQSLKALSMQAYLPANVLKVYLFFKHCLLLGLFSVYVSFIHVGQVHTYIHTYIYTSKYICGVVCRVQSGPGMSDMC